MANEVTTISNDNALVDFNPQKATLLQMRADEKRFPRLRSYPNDKAVLEMSKIVLQAFLYRGQQADPNTIQFTASALVAEMMGDRRFGAAALSFAEIQVAIKRAVLGESEMFGISVSSLYKAVIDFCKTDGHDNARKVEQMRSRARQEALNESPVTPRIIAATGEFIRKHKNR